MSAKFREVDHGWKKLFDHVKEIRNSYAKVGVLADDSKGGEKRESGLTVAEIAAVQEFGTMDERIPSRPFLRLTFEKLQPELREMGAKLAEKVLFDEIDIKKALDIMGLKLSTEAKKTIVNQEGIRPNAESTRRRKEAKRLNEGGEVKALIDTGRLVNAISWVVKEKGEE